MRQRAIGAHVPVGRGLATQGLAYAADVGAEAVQVFLGNARSWATSPGDATEDRRFRDSVASGLPAFVHAPYLVNLGSPDATTARRSAQSLTATVRRAQQIGASGVVVHTGSSVVAGFRDASLRQVARTLLPLLDRLDDDAPALLLEPTAGQGRSLCATLDDLAEYLTVLEHHPHLGLCLDTCHLFAAGHDLAARGETKHLLDRLPDVSGGVPLRLVHANDSMDPVGARRDRHAAIGHGHLGLAPFSALLRHPACRGVPLVVETPGGADQHRTDVATLKRLRSRRRSPDDGLRAASL
jgi:deoxyribonuclease-4